MSLILNQLKIANNLAVGKSSATTTLDIYGNTAHTGSISVQGGLGQANATAYTSANRIIFDNDFNDSARGPNKITLYDGGWLGGLGIHNNTFAYYAGGDHTWYQATTATNAAQLMTVNTTGLGVGKSAPSAKLDVNGNTMVTGSLMVTGSMIMAGDLIPAEDRKYSLGSSTNRWNDLYVISSSVSQITESLMTISNEYTLAVVNGNRVAGFKIAIASQTSSFTIQADKFQVVNDSGNNPMYPFTIENNIVYINSASIKNLTSDNIAANTITANNIKANTITTDKLTANVITANEISASSITTDKLAANSITTNKLTANVITANEISASAITTDKLAANSITTSKLQADCITATQISASVITGDKIAATTITAANIASSTITATQISASAITGDKIAATTITATNIASGTITATQISASAITGDKIAATTITATNIASATITATQISASAITGDKIAGTTITAANIASGTITSTQISASAITGDRIQAGTITSTQISASAITSDRIQARTLTADRIATGAITSTEISAGSINSDRIASRTIQADRIAAGAITATEISASAITADKIRAGTITANEISASAITGDKIQAGAITGNTIVGGTISGVTISGNTVSGNTITGGSINIGSGVFQVDTAGNLTATSATISGAVTATSLTATNSGTIAGWTIGAGGLTSNSSAASKITGNGLTIDASSTQLLIQLTGTYTAKLTGGAAAATLFLGSNTQLTDSGVLTLVGTQFKYSSSKFYFGSAGGETIVCGRAEIGTGGFACSGGGTFGGTVGINSSAILLDANGTVTATSFNSSSSRRYKTNIKDLTKGLDMIQKLRPVTFDWKNKDIKNDIGMIAEEVNEIVPSVVQKNSQGIVEGLDYSRVVAILISGMQELTNKISHLEAKIKDLEK